MSDQITKLPDGSAFFTATVLSHNEAMALPVKQRPLNYRVPESVYMAAWESLGESGCKDSELAGNIVTKLCFAVASAYEDGKFQALNTRCPGSHPESVSRAIEPVSPGAEISKA